MKLLFIQLSLFFIAYFGTATQLAMTDNTNIDGSVALPTFSSILALQQLATRSHPAGRLYWTLSDPPSTHIYVMPNSHTPDTATLVPYTNEQSTSDSLAQELMTRPAVSSLKVDVDQLSQWEEDWVDMHIEHCGSHPGQRRTVIVTDDEEGDEEDSNGNPVKLVMCCGEQRPGASEPLEVRASDQARGVTVDDYVKAVHPWLMSHREQIVTAMRMIERVPADSVLMVNVNAPDALVVQLKDQWIAQSRLNTR